MLAPLTYAMSKIIKQLPDLRGRDLDAPQRTMTLDGKTYVLRFDNRSARIAEDVYDEQYGKPDKGYYEIISEASHGKHAATMAIYYGALIAGGADVSWEDYDRLFTLDAIDEVRTKLLSAVNDMLPPADKDARPNGTSQPQDDGHGAG